MGSTFFYASKVSPLRIFVALSLVSLHQSELCSSLNILGIFPQASRSHFAPGEKLMKELARRGHLVDVISQFPQKTLTTNYRDIPVRLNQYSLVNNVTYANLRQLSSKPVSFTAKLTGTYVCDLMGRPNVQEVLKTEKNYYDVIVIELFAAHCYLAVGQHLDAPIVVLIPTRVYDWLFEPFGNPLNPSYVPGFFTSFSQRMTFWERLRNTLSIFYNKHAMNYYMESQVKQVEKYLGRKLSSMHELYDDVALVLTNTHHSLNDIKPTTPDYIEVGGLHMIGEDQQLTPDLQRWLDESSDGCIYFTFGSMIKIESYPKEVIKIFYEMFERIAPVRGLVKIADTSVLPPGLPENVKTASWLPQIAVLKHKNVKLFITHGGLMGIQEAVAHKVPMIGLPIFGDQPANIALCAEKNIAIALNLETLTADLLTNAVSTVLTDPSYRNNVEKISELFWDRPVSVMETAVYWVEYTATHGKVLKSPATELTWWQLNLLDVYGFILFTVLVILYVMKRIVCFLSRKRRSSNSAKLKKYE